MSEILFEATTVWVDYLCDSCDQGIMLEPKMVMDPGAENIRFLHTCNNCGALLELPDKYPYMRQIKGNKFREI